MRELKNPTNTYGGASVRFDQQKLWSPRKTFYVESSRKIDD